MAHPDASPLRFDTDSGTYQAVLLRLCLQIWLNTDYRGQGEQLASYLIRTFLVHGLTTLGWNTL
jgi:hypothetical protein